jgi:two-component system, NtrC family, nitrogen regulation sensor histidine kinase NtrY
VRGRSTASEVPSDRWPRALTRTYLRPARRETALTLRSKLLFMFVLFALIPILAIGALGYVESLRALESLVASQTSLIAERIAVEVHDRRERIDANVALLAENVETQRMLAAHAAGDSAADRAATAAARPYLLEVRAAMGGDAEWIEFRDASGRELLRLADTMQAAPRDDGDRIVRVTRPLPSGAGSVVVGVPIPALLPPELLDARFGRSGYLVVLDRSTGRALHDPEHIDAIALAHDARHAPVKGSAGSYIARYPDADSTRVATVVTLTDPAWTVLVAGTVDEFSAPFVRLRTTTLTAIALIGLIAATGFFLVLWRATASLRILTAAADEVGHGNFEPRLPAVGEDEVGRLARAFSLMTGRVREMMAQVERGRQMAAVGEFANEIAHEIRNPLTSIKLNLQALERGARQDLVASPLVRPLEISLREVQRLDRVVHGVLRLGRDRSAERATVALQQVVQRALDVARPQLEQRGVHVAVTSTSARDQVLADAAQVEAALLNLLLNAAEATPPGGVVRVSVDASDGGEGSRVRVRIQDGGAGVAPELRERIFQPFFTTKPGGTGLGLALAQRTAEEHGGRLTLATDEPSEFTSGERGAVFVLELPFAPSATVSRSA